ncbi:MAG: hypothetical protein HYS43_01445 [Candidatus Liptonbacteria bacterium]|nr:hypothetical protein [Candidatus Liptonbacteria bacterium]
MKEQFSSAEHPERPSSREEDVDFQGEVAKAINRAGEVSPVVSAEGKLREQAPLEIRKKAETAWRRQERENEELARQAQSPKRQARLDRVGEKLDVVDAATEAHEREVTEMADLAAKYERAKQEPPPQGDLASRIAETASRLQNVNMTPEKQPSSPERDAAEEDAEEAGQIEGAPERAWHLTHTEAVVAEIVGVPEVPSGAEKKEGEEQVPLADRLRQAREEFVRVDARRQGGLQELTPEEKETRERYLATRFEYINVEIEKQKQTLGPLGGHEREQKLREMIRGKFFEEFRNCYDAKTEERMREREPKAYERVVSAWRRGAQWYRSLPLWSKIGVSAALAGGALGAGVAGGATWGVAAASLIGFGRLTQRALAGSATFIALEGFLEKRSQKKISKEFEQKYEEAFDRNAKEYAENPAEGLIAFMKTRDELLEEETELHSGMRERERRSRTLNLRIAGGTTAALQLVPSALFSAFGVEAPGERIPWLSETANGGPSVPSHPDIQYPRPEPGAEGLQRGLPIAPDVSGGGGISHIEGALTETQWKGATSVWNLAERELAARGMFEGLNPAQKTYLIDAIKDRVVADPHAFGLEHADQFDPAKFDYDKFAGIFGNESEMNHILSGMRGLTPEQMESITKNNETLRNFFREHPVAPRTSENYEAILKGEGAYGEILRTESPSYRDPGGLSEAATTPGQDVVLENLPLRLGRISGLQMPEAFAPLKNEIVGVFGDKSEEAIASVNRFLEFHPGASLKQLTAFVGEMDDIDRDTMRFLFGSGGDSAENRLALLRYLLTDERLDINFEHISDFEDLVEDRDRFGGILEYIGAAPTADKLEMLTHYLFVQHAPEITDANRDDILIKILPHVPGAEERIREALETTLHEASRAAARVTGDAPDADIRRTIARTQEMLRSLIGPRI